MTANDVLEELRSIKDVALATVDADGIPRNRVIDCMMVRDGVYYFLTARGKSVYRELIEGGYAAITGLNDKWQTFRLVGKAVLLPDRKKWIDLFFEENPSMESVYPGDSRDILEAFAIRDGQMEWFDLSDTPIRRGSLVLGNAKAEEKGYVITDGCIGCGTCSRGCPQQCITEGEPYVIAQENCLHCGRCFENCPVEAIEHR